MNYEILKNSMEFVYENAIPIISIATGLFVIGTAGYFVKEYNNSKKINNRGLEQKTN